jgi:hypothetical protein
MIFMVIINKYFGKSLSDSKELLSGHDYVDAKTLKKYIKHKSDITIDTIKKVEISFSIRWLTTTFAGVF